MMSENTQCIASALRNSILNLGMIPKVVYQDNGKAFKSKYFHDKQGAGLPNRSLTGAKSEFLAKASKIQDYCQNCDFEEDGFNGVYANLGIHSVFAKPYNARAKVIERFFLEFQEEFEKMMPSYIGTSIEDKPAWLKRGEKLHKEWHKKLTTGSFLSLYTSIVNYLHEREDFFNNLFFTGIFINSNYEQIRQLILNLDEKSNMKYVINTIEGYAKAVDNIIANVNFAKYSPFFKKSKISQLTNQIQDLYIETERSIVIITRNIKISGIESEITTLKISSMTHLCRCCTIAEAQLHHSQSNCSKFIEYKTSIENL